VAITSRRSQVVARYRAAARGDAEGMLLLDGVHLIADATRSGLAVRHVAVTHDARQQREIHDLLAALSASGAEIDAVTPGVIEAMTPVRTPTGIVALAERPADRTARIFNGTSSLVVVGVDIQDPGNIGAIVRVAEAGGASGVVAAGASADPFGWKALRGSMGSALRLPVASMATADAIETARSHGCRIVATAPRGGRTLFDADLTGPLAILIGGEGHGLDAGLIASADERLTIPMEAPVDSLNAATTAALLVYEARRQRM
jgi:RNA methyltransferase, TrmH family